VSFQTQFFSIRKDLEDFIICTCRGMTLSGAQGVRNLTTPFPGKGGYGEPQKQEILSYLEDSSDVCEK